MVVSASRRTDVPAFYGEWFLGRLEAGFCEVKNPYGGRVSRLDLTQPNLEAIVFWTKNPWPFMDGLGQVRDRGIPFYVQFTITPYDREVEKAVIPVPRAIEAAHCLADAFGPAAVVWRYDPIVLGPQTPLEWHLERFEEMASGMSGATDEVVTKFLVPYAKTRRNMTLDWRDPSAEERRRMFGQLGSIAATNGLRLTVCSEPKTRGELPEARCIDPIRLERVGVVAPSHRKAPSRDGCRCVESRDVGEYDTCPQGCAYCYATRNQAKAAERFRRHDPATAAM